MGINSVSEETVHNFHIFCPASGVRANAPSPCVRSGLFIYVKLGLQTKRGVH